MISTLIKTNTPKQALDQLYDLDLSSVQVDTFILNPPNSIGIDQVRELGDYLKTAPVKADLKTIIVQDAAKLTPAAQHALLKTLEEPPPYARIIICTPNTDIVIPTIVSRCRLIYHHGEKERRIKESYRKVRKELKDADTAKRTYLAGQYTQNQAAAVEAVASLLYIVYSEFHQHPTPQKAKLLKLLQTSHRQLHQNANPPLTLEHTFLSEDW